VLARLAWDAPRRAAAQRATAESVLAEADVLGVTAAGGLTGYSRTLLDGSRAAAQHALQNALPDPVDYFLVQPDLTVVVPGPPTAELADELALAADLESSGGASVYRITEASVRRALDAGRSAADLAALVTQRSRTPVPQALSYLIADSARRHGVLRAGFASAYLRCDDAALLDRVVADRDVASLQLRRLAPAIVVSTAPLAKVLEFLRDAGYAPAAEAADGAVMTLGVEAPRATSRTAVRVIRPRSSVESASQLAEVVRRIRSGDTLSELSQRVQPIIAQVPGVTSASTMALLRQAIRDGRRVLLGHAEPDGTVTRHTILPISLAGGFVRGHESSTQRLQSFALHRLTAASLLAEDDFDDGDDDPA
ncbi:MAG: helicase-associated domain-containing protein, partial [Actinomycetota bacterium]|nr:helicase-associated domain-containing protein [Actinomycetota bacterium]